MLTLTLQLLQQHGFKVEESSLPAVQTCIWSTVKQKYFREDPGVLGILLQIGMGHIPLQNPDVSGALIKTEGRLHGGVFHMFLPSKLK